MEERKGDGEGEGEHRELCRKKTKKVNAAQPLRVRGDERGNKGARRLCFLSLGRREERSPPCPASGDRIHW